MRRLPARWLGASASPVTTAGCVARLHERFGLRPGLSVADAGDILWALTAPELTLRLVHRRRWSFDKYEVWPRRWLTRCWRPQGGIRFRPAVRVSASRSDHCLRPFHFIGKRGLVKSAGMTIFRP
jgi:hypothetical protein